MKGFTFSQNQPNLTIIFNADDILVTKMAAQNIVTTYPTAIGNTRQICATLYNQNSTRLAYSNGTIIPMLISSPDDPTIEGWFENVKMIRLRLCNTTDNQAPRNFRFGVYGCHSSINTVIMRDVTTPSPVQGITTTAVPRKKFS